jgi:hypothetical protein
MNQQESKSWPPHKREEYIRGLRNPVGKGTVEFQGQLQTLDIFVVPIEMPIYRLENGRTIDRQEEYVAKNGKPADFFTRDVESWEALSAQDEILQGMVNEAGLLKYFRKNKQTEPLILTQDGRVVNGNRRLSAMRKLLLEDPDSFAHFKHIRVVILPKSVDKDVDELEAKLQLHEDIRADYSWTTEAMILRSKQQIYNLSLGDVARMYDVSEKAARQKLQMLADADRYLNSRGRPKRYSELRKKEFAFKQLYTHRQKIAEAPQADLFTELVFLLIDQPAVDARQYSRIPLIQKDLPRFSQAITSELAASTQGQNASSPQAPKASEDARLLSGEDSVIRELQTVRLAADPTNREKLQVVVRDVVESVEAKRRQENVENQCLDNVAEAYTALENAINCLTADSNLTGVETHLKNIEEAVQKIRTKMTAYAED